MRGAVIYGPRDVRVDERHDPKIVEPPGYHARDELPAIKALLWTSR